MRSPDALPQLVQATASVTENLRTLNDTLEKFLANRHITHNLHLSLVRYLLLSLSFSLPTPLSPLPPLLFLVLLIFLSSFKQKAQEETTKRTTSQTTSS